MSTIVGVGAVGLRCGEVGAMGNGLACKEADVRIMSALGKVVAGLGAVFAPASELAAFAEKSSDSERNTLVRKVWSRVSR